MATTESSTGNSREEELEDLAECCICTEVYTDPKALPCIHTFCMKCLQETGLKTIKGPGDEMPCPICRRLFKIPPEGYSGLPKNFFIERLIQVSTASDPSAVSAALCSVCLEESQEQEGQETPTADAYCVDCKHKLCAECCSEHKKFKLTKNHKLIPINEHKSDKNLLTDLPQSVCEVHEQKILDVYCADCKTVVCAICFIEDHKNHEGSHVNKCLDGFRKQIQNNTESMNECISQAQVKKAELVKMREEMQRRVESLECDIEKRKDEIKQLTDKNASSLVQRLCSERQSRLKEIQMATDDIDAYLSYLESYNSYCQKLLNRGSASDICWAVSDLSVRAFELQQQCQPTTERRISDFKFCFRQSELEELLEDDCGNLVGEIDKESDTKLKKRSKQSPLAEPSNEIDLMRKEIESERTEKESLRSANEQLRINVAKEIHANKTFTEELSNYNAHIARLKQELDNNKIANNTLQTNIDKLKLELDAEKTNSISLQTSNDKFVEEHGIYRATVETLGVNAKKLRAELETTKKDNNEKILIIEQKHEQQQKTWMKEKEQLNNQIEEKRRLIEKFLYKLDPVLVQTIRSKAGGEEQKQIRGLTILDKELFFVSRVNSYVEAYDSINSSFSRRWNLKELIRPEDIVSCDRYKCLYIFDFKGDDKSKEILRVHPNGKLIKKWSTGNDYGRLSVTYESCIILTVFNKNELTEYSPDGQLIREINFSSGAGILHPWHAIKLTNGHFVVSHGNYDDCLHRVCKVDADGKLEKSFGGKYGPTIEQMNCPVYLSVDRNGFVMVADLKNSRVLLLDSDLQLKREILSKEKHELRYPKRILLDESNGRMFVADSDQSGKGRILSFDFK